MSPEKCTVHCVTAARNILCMLLHCLGLKRSIVYALYARDVTTFEKKFFFILVENLPLYVKRSASPASRIGILASGLGTKVWSLSFSAVPMQPAC